MIRLPVFAVLLALSASLGAQQVVVEQSSLDTTGELDYVTDLALEGPWLAAGGATPFGSSGLLVYRRVGSDWVMEPIFGGGFVELERDRLLVSDAEFHHTVVYGLVNDRWKLELTAAEDYAALGGNRLLTTSPSQTTPVELTVWKRGLPWAPEAVLTPTPAQTLFTCGLPMAMEGDTLAFRAKGTTGTTSVHVYVREAGSWVKQAELVPEGYTNIFFQFIPDLALSGRTLAALFQAPGKNTWDAFVWEREGRTWRETAHLDGGIFGAESLALEDDTLALASSGSEGVVRVYERSLGTWTESARLVASDGANIGRAVALDGRTVVVSTHFGLSPSRILQFRLPAFPRVTEYGCGVNPEGSLTLVSGAPALGSSVRLALANPLGTQAIGSLAFLVAASRADTRHPCGTLVPGLGMAGGPGEWLLRRGPGFVVDRRSIGTWNGPDAPAEVELAIPNDPALVGHAFYLQGALHDPTPGASVPWGLTQALAFEIGR